MDFDKQIWILFKMDRSDYNRFDRKTLKILSDIFEKGKKEGRKEQIKLTGIFLKSNNQ